MLIKIQILDHFYSAIRSHFKLRVEMENDRPKVPWNEINKRKFDIIIYANMCRYSTI